mmetsp:Transcript_66128/g.144461  ORF Transcript_66128/g.144461 Transcript_66128/m.144461 type:complete len:249 (+) Transcript_66128:431-1177(+)
MCAASALSARPICAMTVAPVVLMSMAPSSSDGSSRRLLHAICHSLSWSCSRSFSMASERMAPNTTANQLTPSSSDLSKNVDDVLRRWRTPMTIPLGLGTGVEERLFTASPGRESISALKCLSFPTSWTVIFDWSRTVVAATLVFVNGKNLVWPLSVISRESVRALYRMSLHPSQPSARARATGISFRTLCMGIPIACMSTCSPALRSSKPCSGLFCFCNMLSIIASQKDHRSMPEDCSTHDANSSRPT